jgi:hypothetical protein
MLECWYTDKYEVNGKMCLGGLQFELNQGNNFERPISTNKSWAWWSTLIIPDIREVK